MELTADEITSIRLYDEWVREGDVTNNPLWVDSFSQHIFRSMSEGGEVIDVGCGAGRAIGILPDLGIEEYFGIDPSAESIKFCRENFPEYGFEVNNIYLIGETYPARFSGFLLLTTLMHVPRPQLGFALNSLRQCLKKESPGMFSLPFGSEGHLEFINHVGMNLTLFTFKEMETALEQSGFQIDDLFTPDGHMMLGRVTAI